MTNRDGSSKAGVSLLLALTACGMLGGCVAVVAPIAAGGLIGGSRVRHHGRASDTPTAVVQAPTQAAPSVAVTKAPTRAAVAPSAKVASEPPGRVTERATVAADVRAVTVPVPPTPQAEAIPPQSATTWNDVMRYMAKAALVTPDPLKASVLRSPAGKAPSKCGATPTAIVLDAATLGSDDYIYVGALHTMGYEIVFLSAAADLPAEQVRALAKQGVPAPVWGKTLFPNPPGAENAARAQIAARYCVLGLVGDRAADFPGEVLPGAPGARPGWFLVTRR